MLSVISNSIVSDSGLFYKLHSFNKSSNREIFFNRAVELFQHSTFFYFLFFNIQHFCRRQPEVRRQQPRGGEGEGKVALLLHLLHPQPEKQRRPRQRLRHGRRGRRRGGRAWPRRGARRRGRRRTSAPHVGGSGGGRRSRRRRRRPPAPPDGRQPGRQPDEALPGLHVRGADSHQPPSGQPSPL